MPPDRQHYSEYLQTEIRRYESTACYRRKGIETALGGGKTDRVLDVGCGAGQELLYFAEDGSRLCVGVDVELSAGKIFRDLHSEASMKSNCSFLAAAGERLPFDDSSFDLLICRVALPYMNSALALGEMARVLKKEGKLILTIHTPGFYWQMIRRRIGSFSPKQLAYPLICLAGGASFMFRGRQPAGSFWKGKETFHTSKMLLRELVPVKLRIEDEIPADGKGGRTFVIIKD